MAKPMDPDAKDLLAVAGALVLVPAWIFVAACWSGYTIAIAWGWLIAPTFGLPVLTTPQAIGVTMIVGHLAKHVPANKEDVEWGKLVAKTLLGPAFFLFGAYIVTLFL